MRIDAETALTRLREGNRRHAAGAPQHPTLSEERRQELHRSQHPIAAVLGCSDARVAPELVFDQGLGELFVVRVAGYVVAAEVAASLEFAVEQLGVPLLVVLGHQRCGAVRATVEGLAGTPLAAGHLPTLVAAISPSVALARRHPGEDLVEAATHVHVRRTVSQIERLEPILAAHVAARRLRVVGAYYGLATGVVEWLSDNGHVSPPS
jgi:carbonic anhydrase